MRFFALAIAAFVSTTEAVKLHQAPALFQLHGKQQLMQLAAKKHEDMTFSEMFKAIDTDNSGTLSLKEIFTAIKHYAGEHNIELPKGWRKYVTKMFNDVDANGDGEVTKEEIGAAIWNKVDSNNDGEWDLGEVKDAVRGLAEAAGKKLVDGWEQMVEDAFNHVDADGSGKISVEELKTALDKHGEPDFSQLME